MSPSLALESPAFLFYTAMAVGLLVGGGVVLGVLLGLKKNVGHAWKAYRGWLVMVPVLLVVYFLGREAVIVFLTVIAGLGFREFARATALDWLLAAPVYLAIVAVGVACWMNWFELFLVIPAFVIAVIVAIPVVRNQAQDQLPPVAFAGLGFLYFGWMFGHLAFLANSPGAYAILGYLVTAVELNDVGAYTFGKLFGRRLLRSNISPKKTWEGAAGALVVSLLLPLAVRFTQPTWSIWDCLAIGAIVGVGGQVGDLVISVFKRDRGLKDMGATIPGHGGILDRIDSLIYVSPLVFYYLRFR